VLFALGYCLVSGADEALLYDSLVATGRVADAGRHIARLHMAQLVGIVVGALGGSVIASHFGVRTPMACQSIPIAASALLAATLVEPRLPASHTRTRNYRMLVLSGLRRLRAERDLAVLVADMVLVGGFAWTLIWLYQPLLGRAGIGRASFGTIHALLCLGQISVLRSIGWLAPLVGGRARYLRLAAALAALAMLGLAAPLPKTATVALILVAMALGLSRMPIASTAVNARVDADVRATMLSTVSMLRTLVVCLVNPLVGLVADRSLAGTMVGLGCATLAVAIFSPVGQRHLPD